MPIDPQEFAKMLGAEIVGQVPDVGGGPFDMARLAHIMHEHLTPSLGEQPGLPSDPNDAREQQDAEDRRLEAVKAEEQARRQADPNWVTRCKVAMSDATLQSLTELAEEMSTNERKISPMQAAAHL